MKRHLILLNVVLGPLVLVSYIACGVGFSDEVVAGLWGTLPDSVRGFYSAHMFFAAAGYFAFGNYILRELDASRVVVFSRGYGVLLAAYAAMLLGSALWMPLTSVALSLQAAWLTPVIVVDLWIVALASLALLFGVASASPRGGSGARRIAIVGAGFFCVQTVLLDAIVWPIFFEL